MAEGSGSSNSAGLASSSSDGLEDVNPNSKSQNTDEGGGENADGGAKARSGVIANANSRSVSVASATSEESNDSPRPDSIMMDRVDIMVLTNDVREFKEALANFRKVFHSELSITELKVACHERQSEVLRILHLMMSKYPSISTQDLVQSAHYLINQVKDLSNAEDDAPLDENQIINAIDGLARSFSNRVSGYIIHDIDSATSSTSSRDKEISQANVLENMTLDLRVDSLANDQIDNILISHHLGVDYALRYAKSWAKYSKDVMSYVEKRTNMQLELARGLSKLAQATRPILTEESYLPFQNIFCTSIDQDLEMCSSLQATCSRLQGSSFIEPFYNQRQEHQKIRKLIKDRWTKELKVLQESVNNLKKSKGSYRERIKEYERCREAVRIAEQGAEIGATGENKVDKRKRLEEDALEKKRESKLCYAKCVEEANRKHRQLLQVKTELIQQIRELVTQCDQTVKAVTMQYFQINFNIASPLAPQFQELNEKTLLYEPGSQFMEFVRDRMGEFQPQSKFPKEDPFIFEDESPTQSDHSSVPRRPSASLDDYGSGTYRFRGDSSGTPGSIPVWTPTGGNVEPPSDSDSVESRESCKSRDTSPSASPLINSQHHGGSSAISVPDDAEDVDVIDSGEIVGTSNMTETLPSSSRDPNRRPISLSLAAKTHKFRKLKAPSKCRECEKMIYLQGFGCHECGLSAHKKCMETLALQCGHKRLPSKSKTLGVHLGQHLLDSGAPVPPLVLKCVQEIEKRGINLEGIYRKPGAKTKIEKLCQLFDTAPELVDLTDSQPFTIADVLKFYIRKLPEPLITIQLYPDFITVANTPLSAAKTPEQCEAWVIKELTDLCQQLPKPHFRTLAFLMHHLSKVASFSDENNMNAFNLSLMFGPALLRTNEDSLSLSSSSHEKEGKVVQLLIMHALTIFGPPEVIPPRECSTRQKSSSKGIRYGLPKRKSKAARKFGTAQEEERSIEVADEFSTQVNIAAATNEDFVSDEDEDAEAIPSCWLPDDSAKTKKSPLLNRASSPPKIIKASLKSFSGLEGVTPERLSTQDSLETIQRLPKQPSSEVSLSSRKSIPHDAGSNVRTHRASEILFSRVGRAAKKHSLDEDFLSPPLSHPPLSERLSSEPGLSEAAAGGTRKTPSPGNSSSDVTTDVLKSTTSPGSGRTSLTIGIGGQHRSSSLSEDHQANLSVSDQKRKFLSSTSTETHHHHHHSKSITNINPPPALCSTSFPTSNITNLDVNRVTIQVTANPIKKQSSVERDES